ncbi:flagellar biosynthesis protein FlhB [bacterium]|nr:flagellar biosynthesis protein FlhB [bacterium]
MAESKESFQEKTEEPTAKRKSESRKDGNVAKSMEINSTLVLLTGMVALTVFGGFMLTQMLTVDRFLFSQIGQIEITTGTLRGYLFSGSKVLLTILLPVMLPIAVIGIVANILQFGFLFTFKAIKPKFDKLNPISGLKKMFSKNSLVQLVKNLVKVTVIGWVGYLVISGLTDDMIPLMDQSPWAIFLWICQGTMKIGFYTIIALLMVSLLDLKYTRWEHHEKLKMTKQEVKDEARQSDGDPKVKAKIKQIQFKTALQRMMKNVHIADVVITNPTHVAVALKYDSETMTAPQVVAKGKRLIAMRIREIAAEHDIPIMEEPPLARALYKSADVGQQIPGNLYQAVAEILAYVYRLRNESQHNYN